MLIAKDERAILVKKFYINSKTKNINNSCIKLLYYFRCILSFGILFTILLNIYYIKKRISNLEEIIVKKNSFIQLNYTRNNNNISEELNNNGINNSISSTVLNKTPINYNYIENGEFNQNINDKYIELQKYFCDNQTKFYNKNYEERIRLTEIKFEDKKYTMYAYNKLDFVSNEIIGLKQWERGCTKRLLAALNYYSNKKKIENKDIYIIDIGANIGWYSFIFGKYGYKVIAFEPSKLNDYILRKNYCLNNEVNVTIINKGLYNEEKICDLYNLYNNEGNGMVICEHNNTLPYFLIKKKTGEIILTKLSNYISYLSDKNLALIKIDVEGSEGKAFEGGIELITKYHVPFIFIEFTPESLRLHGTDPKKFLQLFVDNGYKLGLFNFFANFTSIDDIMKKNFNNYGLINIYIVHSKILE